MGLADKLIAKQASNDLAPHYGVDETGLPVPSPINADYVVARIIGNKDIYQANGDFYIGHTLYKQTPQSLIALCGHPRLVEFDALSPQATMSSKSEVNYQVWRQIKKVINEEYGLVWEMLRHTTPSYNKRLIRINDDLVWDKDSSTIKFMPKGVS